MNTHVLREDNLPGDKTSEQRYSVFKYIITNKQSLGIKADDISEVFVTAYEESANIMVVSTYAIYEITLSLPKDPSNWMLTQLNQAIKDFQDWMDMDYYKFKSDGGGSVYHHGEDTITLGDDVKCEIVRSNNEVRNVRKVINLS